MLGELNKHSFLVAIFAVLFLAALAFGAPVSFEKAQNVAQKHLERKHGGKIKSAQKRPQMRAFASPAAPTATPYFIIEKENDGFVIVSGDDIAAPIFGEVDKGNFDKENMPPALLWLLETYEEQIAEAVKNGATQDNETKELWEEALLDLDPILTASYSEKLLTTTWNQSSPYNLQCPLDGTQRSITGCVATAMAQIIKYWQYPAYGIGTSSAYQTRSKKISVPSVNFNTNFDYANMLNSYTSNGGTTAQREAVSKLMYHCGASVKMDYASSASGAYSKDVATALTQYFDYDNSIRYVVQSASTGISASDWKDLVLGQIENDSPVFYGGTDVLGGGGHAFIIDGYNTNTDLFHLNWGWGGAYDGFFVLTALNPNRYQFNSRIDMTINIMPNQGGNPPSKIKVSRFDVLATEAAVNADIRAKMNYGIDFSGKIGLAVISGDTVSMVLDSAAYSISNTYSATSGRYTVNYKDAKLNKQFGADMLPYSGSIITLQVVTKRGTGNWAPVGETYQILVPTLLYTITYNLDGGIVSPANPESYTIFETSGFTLNNPAKTGYTFAGWTGANDTIPQDTVTIAQGSIGDLEYTANWTLNTYAITYDLDGGTASPSANPESYTVETEAFTLNNPTKTGYTFAGWTGTNDTIPQDTLTIEQGSTGDLEYTANWTLNTYTVTFLDHDGTELLQQTVNHGSTATAPLPPIRIGHAFSAWDTDFSTVTEDLTVTAMYVTPILPQITINSLLTQTNAAIEVYNLSGKLVSRQISHLPKGVYIVKASLGSEKQILKVLVK